MVTFNLELVAYDLTHNDTDTQELLSSLFATIFNPEKYYKLDKKAYTWFENYANAFFAEANIVPYFNLYVKKSSGPITDLNEYIKELPLEHNHIFLGKIYEIAIIDEHTKNNIGSMFMLGICNYNESNDCEECIIYLLIHEKE